MSLEVLRDGVLRGTYLRHSLSICVLVESCSEETIGLSHRSLEPHAVALDSVCVDARRTEPCLHGVLASVARTEQGIDVARVEILAVR